MLKFRRSYPIPPLFEDPVVNKIAKNHDKTAAQVLLRFITQLGIAVIPKSTNATRLKQNIDVSISSIFGSQPSSYKASIHSLITGLIYSRFLISSCHLRK